MSILPIGFKGYFIDERDNQLYHTIIMPDGKEWMIDNLNYKTGNCWAYNNDESNRQKYGLLYDWKMAMKACPSGWRLPDNDEWDELISAVGGNAGKKLKSQTGWNLGGNGTDKYGFSALPGGYRFYYDDNFYDAGNVGGWWSATEYRNGNAYYRDMGYNIDHVYEDWGKDNGYSVRCLRN
jgi:uncharacterized protein (TIGR02145 family)